MPRPQLPSKSRRGKAIAGNYTRDEHRKIIRAAKRMGFKSASELTCTAVLEFIEAKQTRPH